MGRQTAFPGVYIDSISIEKPPYSEKGVIKEFVGRGVTKEFDALQRASELSKKTVHKFEEDAEDMIGPLREDYRIKYHLKVRAVPTKDSALLQALQGRSMSSRVRAFTRVKNPFEPTVIDVSEPVKDNKLSSDLTGDVYSITTTVSK